MNYKDIKLSPDGRYFTYKGKKIFKTFLAALKFHEPGLAPVCDETGWYHITTEGKPLYTQRYKRAFGYYCERAAVVDHNNNWFHIDIKGNRAYPQNYAWVGNYQEELCTVRDHKGLYFHIDKKGQPIYTEKYTYAGDFKDGYATVRLSNGLFKHIDRLSNDLNGKLFTDLGVFHKNFATAKDEKGWFHIDRQGNQLYPQRYAMIEPFYNGQALVTTFEGEKIIIDEQGKVILKLTQNNQL